MPSGFDHANHPGAFINPKCQRTEVKGLVRSKAGTARIQKKTPPTRSNTPGKKDFITAESHSSIPCSATAAAQNLANRKFKPPFSLTATLSPALPRRQSQGARSKFRALDDILRIQRNVYFAVGATSPDVREFLIDSDMQSCKNPFREVAG